MSNLHGKLSGNHPGLPDSSRLDDLENLAKAAKNKRYIITGLSAKSKVTRKMFVVFDLEWGGSISIPPDQIMRMWNEEQRRKAESLIRGEA